MVSVITSCALMMGSRAIVQLYHGENKLIFNEMMMRSTLY